MGIKYQVDISKLTWVVDKKQYYFQGWPQEEMTPRLTKDHCKRESKCFAQTTMDLLQDIRNNNHFVFNIVLAYDNLMTNINAEGDLEVVEAVQV